MYTSAQTHDTRISALAADLEEMVAALHSRNPRRALRGVASQTLLITRMKPELLYVLDSPRPALLRCEPNVIAQAVANCGAI